jgi:hypothetical protein
MPLLLSYSHLGLTDFFECRHDATVRSARRSSQNSYSTHFGASLLMNPAKHDRRNAERPGA